MFRLLSTTSGLYPPAVALCSLRSGRCSANVVTRHVAAASRCLHAETDRSRSTHHHASRSGLSKCPNSNTCNGTPLLAPSFIPCGTNPSLSHPFSKSAASLDTGGNKDSEVSSFRNELKNLLASRKATPSSEVSDERPVPAETDIAIIGGGSIGLSVAYWLMRRNPNGFNITIVERDPSYTRASTTLSVASIRQQFSLPENIKMSLFSAEFLRNIREYLSVLDLDPPDIQFNHQGYLILAGSEEAAESLTCNWERQLECGAKVDLLSPERLQTKFPWLNSSDVHLATYGLSNEGWFDPWLFLTALKVKCLSLGVKFVKGEVVGFEADQMPQQVVTGGSSFRKQLQAVQVRSENNQTYPMKFAVCVNCAGPWSGEVGRMAGIGVGDEGPNVIPIPVEPRKRFVYVFHCPNGPGLDTPMIFDFDGVYLRREGLGGYYLCGASPASDEEEPDTTDLEVDYSRFDEFVWPSLAHRVPAFENLKLKSAWAGYYDYNYFDQNLIIGNHPYYRNLMMATGCSGHGIQQSPAIGRAMAEYILDGDYQTIDLSRFCFDRVMDNEKVLEDVFYIK